MLSTLMLSFVVLSLALLSGILLNVIMLHGITPSVIMLNVDGCYVECHNVVSFKLSIASLSIIMLTMLSDIILSVVILNIEQILIVSPVILSITMFGVIRLSILKCQCVTTNRNVDLLGCLARIEVGPTVLAEDSVGDLVQML
jgi:hypothetical protein